MDSQPDAGDLNALGRRLGAWQPATGRLDRDRMLFDAGRDSARSGWGRAAWPLASGGLALLAATLAIGFMRERTARLESVAELARQRTPALVSTASAVPAVADAARAAPSVPERYLAARSPLTENLDAWPVLVAADAAAPAPPHVPILQATSSGDSLDP